MCSSTSDSPLISCKLSPSYTPISDFSCTYLIPSAPLFLTHARYIRREWRRWILKFIFRRSKSDSIWVVIFQVGFWCYDRGVNSLKPESRISLNLLSSFSLRGVRRAGIFPNEFGSVDSDREKIRQSSLIVHQEELCCKSHKTVAFEINLDFYLFQIILKWNWKNFSI